MSFQQFLVKLTLSLLTSHGDRFLVWLELWVMSEDIHLLTHFITVIYWRINRLHTQILVNQSLFGTKLDFSPGFKGSHILDRLIWSQVGTHWRATLVMLNHWYTWIESVALLSAPTRDQVKMMILRRGNWTKDSFY